MTPIQWDAHGQAMVPGAEELALRNWRADKLGNVPTFERQMSLGWDDRSHDMRAEADPR